MILNSIMLLNCNIKFCHTEHSRVGIFITSFQCELCKRLFSIMLHYSIISFILLK